MSDTYVVNECFKSFQGEGIHSGRGCWFIRLQGCDQGCSFCDSADTWKPELKTKKPRMTAESILETIEDGLPFVVVTGGEPTLYDLRPIVNAIHARGMKAHIETAGHHPIKGDFDWVTLSPKPFAKLPMLENIEKANEVKIIVEGKESLYEGINVIDGLSKQTPIWLHPEWSKRDDVGVRNLITETVTRLGDPYRAGWQIHKLYDVR